MSATNNRCTTSGLLNNMGRREKPTPLCYFCQLRATKNYTLHTVQTTIYLWTVIFAHRKLGRGKFSDPQRLRQLLFHFISTTKYAPSYNLHMDLVQNCTQVDPDQNIIKTVRYINIYSYAAHMTSRHNQSQSILLCIWEHTDCTTS